MANPPENQTQANASKFDFEAFPSNTCFYDRRSGLERRDRVEKPAKAVQPAAPAERREKKERRRRIDPTTFEKQYTAEEMEFMTAMQRFKVQTGTSFPTYGEVLRVASSIGYRKVARLINA